MAVLDISVMSSSLMRTVPVKVLLPADKIGPDGKLTERRQYKTLYLLHGIIGSQNDWTIGTNIARWALEKDLCVVMPAGENKFYVDNEKEHNLFGQYIGQELPELMQRMFPLSARREDNFIGGLSMGGYGALLNGFKYSRNFSRIIALSSALITYDIDKAADDTGNFMGSRSYLESIFGDLSQVENSDKNPVWLARKIKEAGQPLPEIYMAVGKSDGLLGVNRRFLGEIRSLGYTVTYEEGEGAHEWDFWGRYIQKAIDWLPLSASGQGVTSGSVRG